MENYDPKKIEFKWQKFWEENKTFEVEEIKDKQKFYSLIEFPYPSGEGLHVGHPRSYTAMDIVSRQKRMQGYNVLYPIGFDAFGLPTENYAIKTGRPPAEVTAENIETFTRQLKSLGYSFDWSRQVNTTDPKYYKWTQWIFLQFFKHGLAYKKAMPINWCPSCKIGLANEEVVDGKCERCGGEVEMRDKEQWMLAITKYADKLLEGLKDVDYIPQAKIQQENWIGKSSGASVKFEVLSGDDSEKIRNTKNTKIRNTKFEIEVFTTRPDTLFGATYMVLAPEHELAEKLKDKISNWKEVEKYIKKAKKKSELERTELQKEKTGVELKGVKAINPVNNEEIPVWVADYVLISYGTGAIMAVPAHDERDFEFAQKFDLKIRCVVRPYGRSIDPKKTVSNDVKDAEIETIETEKPFCEEGRSINSDFISNLPTKKAIEKMIDWLEEKGFGEREVNYKLRDWVFSRQRYWGEPIPLVHCQACEKKKHNYVLLHGFKSTGLKLFRAKLKDELEKKGHSVSAPDMPNTKKPNVLEQADYVLKNIDFDEDTVIVAHSLGGPVAFRILEKLKTKVAKVVLADTVLRPEFNDEARPLVEASDSFDFDFKKIKSSADEFILLADSDYGTIKKEHFAEMQKLLDARLVEAKPNERHFEGEDEPEVTRLSQATGWVPIPEEELPLELPQVEKYEPTDTGESPLAPITDWVNTKCPKCGGPAKRETDTMPNWAGSSWYFLRYCDPDNDKEFASQDKLKYWTPVDWYNGGMEHTVLHLLYSRFWNQFLHDIGQVPTSEPYKKRTSHGMILAKGGEKMSKSKGNVVNPDEMIQKFGADAFRIYIMFMGPFDQAVEWDTNGLVGVRRFLDKVWALQEKVSDVRNAKTAKVRKGDVERMLHQTIKKVSDDIDKMHFNTAIAKMMELANELTKQEEISLITYQLFLKILSPFAPHLCEELWSLTGNKNILAFEPWPEYDEELAKEEQITLAVQINGKLRDTLQVPAEIEEEEAKKLALESEKVQKWLEGKEPKKVIYVKGKLVSIVV